MIYRCSFSLYSAPASWMRGNKLLFTEVGILFKHGCVVRDCSGLLQGAPRLPKEVFFLNGHLIKIRDIVSVVLNCRLHHFLWVLFVLNSLITIIQLLKAARRDGNCSRVPSITVHLFQQKTRENFFWVWNVKLRQLCIFCLWAVLFYFSANFKYPWEMCTLSAPISPRVFL